MPASVDRTFGMYTNTCSVQGGARTLPGDEQTTIRVTDLAERIVEEISEADQDWRAIELRARDLVELLARLAARQAPAR
jgi:hypothetical protein